MIKQVKQAKRTPTVVCWIKWRQEVEKMSDNKKLLVVIDPGLYERGQMAVKFLLTIWTSGRHLQFIQRLWNLQARGYLPLQKKQRELSMQPEREADGENWNQGRGGYALIMPRKWLEKFEKGFNRFKIKEWDAIMKETAEGNEPKTVSWILKDM